MRVEGDAVQGFTLMFLRQWEVVTRKSFDYSPFLYAQGGKVPSPVSSGDMCGAIEAECENVQVGAGRTTVITEAERVAEGQVCVPSESPVLPSAEEVERGRGGVFIPYASGLEYRDPVVRDIYAGVISQANERLWIMTPYFVPDDTITSLLAGKALSGVDVRIVLPGVPDKGFVYLISLDNADKLTKSGVKVYTMSDAFVHTKSVLTEKCAVIGSANFDLRSFFQQYENALFTDDKKVMEGLCSDFENTFPECVQRMYIKHRSGLLRSLITAILQIFAPMM